MTANQDSIPRAFEITTLWGNCWSSPLLTMAHLAYGQGGWELYGWVNDLSLTLTMDGLGDLALENNKY